MCNDIGIEYSINKSSEIQIRDFLWRNKDAFNPPFNTTTNIDSYSKKLNEKASRIELWEGSSLNGLLCFYTNIEIEELYISYFCVSNKCIGKGFGKTMFKMLQERPHKTIVLEVRKNNTNAILFYKKFGFKATSENQEKILMKLLRHD